MLNRADFYDAELRRHNRHLRAATRAGIGDRVLDVGCGAGQTTREVARTAAEGSVLGVDISAEMLEIARRRSDEEGLRNVVFEQGDAQPHAFPATSFDLCISRFGVMFFKDAPAAFANIGRAMRAGGRLVWMVWQSQDRNVWSTAIRQALVPKAAASVDVAAPFSLGDPDTAAELLNAAGFTSIEFADVREPVFYGPDVDTAFDALISLYLVKDALARTGEPPEKALRRLRDLLEAHVTTEGVFFDSRAWIITAHRRRSG
ncbi:class I SAM-dependent methyltransferase [Roseibium salinum]|uniref:Methyltransferase domain-containing protein n=1 Tax=Roseibium salinum TaxID=1604349 RepID=A0ABT3R251_9HYPH|nr:class I SAM-dependent methyltransferase [Roseibium sp. DSM 29163]MCX2723239.1 methyltransferase domain-containing protein [Roseibium sp. DSM 29163]